MKALERGNQGLSTIKYLVAGGGVSPTSIYSENSGRRKSQAVISGFKTGYRCFKGRQGRPNYKSFFLEYEEEESDDEGSIRQGKESRAY